MVRGAGAPHIIVPAAEPVSRRRARHETRVARIVCVGEDAGMDIETIRPKLSFRLLSDTDAAWDAARRPWNLAVDQRPRMVAFPETAAQVMEVAGIARELGLRLAPQGTGHGAGALASLEGCLLVNMSELQDLEVDPAAGRIRIGAGVPWARVQAAAAEHGLAGLAGSAPDVGVVGYSLGGGLGWLGRRYGLACNGIVGADVVTADGRLLRVDAEREPDLFWALRGGGGGLGIVTAMEFTLHPVRELYAGDLFWPMERAPQVLRAWRDWAAGLPDTVTSVGRLLNLPPIPQIPEPLRGRSFVLVEAACIGTETEGIELLRPLRDLGPEIDTFATMPPTGLGALHMDPPDPSPAFVDGALIASLPDAALDALLGVAGPGSGSPLLSVELRQLGGALARVAPGSGALASLDGEFLLGIVSLVMNEGMAAAAARHAGSVMAAMRDWRAPRDYLNFAERADVTTLLTPEACERLRRVKARYDPEDRIVSGHPIAPRR
jgi:FAD/FMN-containing dehydrogenase